MSQPRQVDLFDPAFVANPYPTYARLRSCAPIYRVPLTEAPGVWLITRYEDVAGFLKDDRFVREERNALTPEQLAKVPPQPEVIKRLGRDMLDTDPPPTTSGSVRC